ncbi:MAG: choice-of-anchor V domain-containing protein [Thermoplasmatota archaeon]
MKRAPALLILTAVTATALAAVSSADFGGSEGFSGRRGATCDLCHTLDPLGATPSARVFVEGLPDAWDYGGSYDLTISMEGGPPAHPAPTQPQGGFDLEVEGGHLVVPASMTGLVRLVGEDTREATYTADGSLRRSWQVTWIAPELPAPATDIQLWVAGVAANGNHVIGQEGLTAGELGDATDAQAFQVAPSAAATTQWSTHPLGAPSITLLEVTADRATFLLTGPVGTSHFEHRITGSAWETTEALLEGATQVTYQGLPGGDHDLEARALVANRTSAIAQASFVVPGETQEAPLPLGTLPLALAAAAGLARRRG